MKPATFNITFTRGDAFSLNFRLRERIWDPIDEVFTLGDYLNLTGWVGKSQVRSDPDDAAVKAEATVTIDPDQVTNKGKGSISLTSTQTALLEDGWFYDLELTDTIGDKHTYLAGKTKVKKDVTRV